MSHSFSNNFARAAALMLLAATFMPGGITFPDSRASEAAADETILAAELAQILNSSEIIIGDGERDERARPIWSRILISDADVAEFEREHPGTIDELLDTVMPIINRSLVVRLPVLQQRQATLYAQTFDAAELAFLVHFYSSPTGKKMLQLVIQNLQTSNMEAAILASEEMALDTKAVLADVQATSRAIAPQLGAEDQVALMELGRSPALPKMQAMAAQTQQIAIDWYDEYLPGEEEEIDAAMEDVFTRRMKISK